MPRKATNEQSGNAWTKAEKKYIKIENSPEGQCKELCWRWGAEDFPTQSQDGVSIPTPKKPVS